MNPPKHEHEHKQKQHPAITGGCLCGHTRYTMSFPPGSAWPPDAHTCQCTQCRKNTGALVAPYLTVSPSQITWTPPHSSPSSTFKRYQSSPGAWRGFCGECGSALTWVGENENGGKEEVEVLTGSVDERWLVGVEVSGDGGEQGGEDGPNEGKVGDGGKGMRREGGVGRELCVPTGGNFWCRNQIVGVTDRVVGGRKFVEGSRLGKVMD